MSGVNDEGYVDIDEGDHGRDDDGEGDDDVEDDEGDNVEVMSEQEDDEEADGDDDDGSDNRHILVVFSRQRANFRSASLFRMDGRFCESVHVLGIIHSLSQHLSRGVSNDLDHYILR